MTIEELAVALQRVEDRSKSNSHRVEVLEKRQKEISEVISAVGRIDEKVDTFNRNINEKVDVLVGRLDKSIEKTDSKLQQILDKPAKRWDAIVEKVLLGVVSAIVVYMMAKLGF